MKAWRICEEELKRLPDNNQVTFKYCDRFSHVFVFDGKYFNVADKQYDWVLLWGIDYFRHDIPVFTVASSENYQSWSKFFFHFRLINHHPKLLVCDDNTNLKMAARYNFPEVKIQTCFNHFKENIRRDLRVRSDDTYKKFMERIEDIFEEKLNDEVMNKKLFGVYRDYQSDPVCVSVLLNIEKHKEELLGYRGFPHAPVTTNLIEGMNSHLEKRLQSLCSFQDINHAKLWLNGYVLKRRFTKFTDCRTKFRCLKGKTGVELTKKKDAVLPVYF
ncbi:MAG: transposase [bacterium]|nr:transposase [bacterium]